MDSSTLESEGTGSTTTTTTTSTRQHFVFSDPITFRLLEADPCADVVERDYRLVGYEIYMVEQWACSRQDSTFVINTYTGDSSRTIVVSVLGVPNNFDAWSSRLKVFFKSLDSHYARRKETPLGTMLVTSLSSFPSGLTVIPVPDGDANKHWEDFIVNENLKRLGCSGRAGLNLLPPMPATQSKFHQLYRTSDRIPLYSAVIGLVRLCQIALIMFDKLDPAYLDGLLCDKTEQAISEWWTDLGQELYSAEPNDGILGPMTVAALLGMYVGARNRLSTWGAPVPKDAFDFQALKRGISYFQKSQKIARTRRLDMLTLTKLHRATARASSNDGWAGVPKAVKSTVAELSGKGGEMMMNMVGREKAGIGDIETVDIDRFVRLVRGDTAKWLWYGKARKSQSSIDKSGGAVSDLGEVSGKEDQGGHAKPGLKKIEAEGASLSRQPTSHENRPPTSGDDGRAHRNDVAEELGQPDGKRAMLKTVPGKIMGTAKGFTGMRAHHHKGSSSEDVSSEQRNPTNDSSLSSPAPLLSLERPKLSTAYSSPEKTTQLKTSGDLHAYNVREVFTDTEALSPTRSEPSDFEESVSPLLPLDSSVSSMRGTHPRSHASPEPYQGTRTIQETPADESTQVSSLLLHRTQSCTSLASKAPPQMHHPQYHPRHLSFSVIEEALLPCTMACSCLDVTSQADLPSTLVLPRARILNKSLDDASNLLPWANNLVSSVTSLASQSSKDYVDLQALHDKHVATLAELTALTSLGEEKSMLDDQVRHLDTSQAKLEYELNALAGRVSDAEMGLVEFERMVADVESRVEELCRGEVRRRDARRQQARRRWWWDH